MTASPNFRDRRFPTDARSAAQRRSDGHHPTHAVPETTSPRAGVPHPRVGQLWVAAAVFALVLSLLMTFVLENGQRSKVSFFGPHGDPPMGVALLLAAVFGVLLVALPGAARSVQLRLRARLRGTPEVTTGPVNFPAHALSNGTTGPRRARPQSAFTSTSTETGG